MRKIDKSLSMVRSTKYKKWIDVQAQTGHFVKGNQYYDDVAMNLYKCQKGVCAYTEMRICPPELYNDNNWEDGAYRLTGNDLKRNDHLGEMDHFDPDDKKIAYWNWDNLFMIEAKINGLKSNKAVSAYLKPDTPGYDPTIYFDYDEKTNRFVPNEDAGDEKMISEIQYMIDEVLFLNHGMIRNERRDYINQVKDKRRRGEQPVIDRFFTSVNIVCHYEST